MTELERRDTPAWWTVAAPSPAAGTAGATDATHTGSLTLNPDLYAANGTVSVFADTAADALSGTITVTLLDTSIDYAFGPDTVGSSVSDHRPFLAVANGASVGIAFEDMAAFPGATSDWDYDDRSWSAAVGGVASGSPIVVDSLQSTFYGEGVVPETLSVTSTVTYDAPGYAGLYQWQYHVANNTFGLTAQRGEGAAYFNVPVPDPSGVDHITNSMGWFSRFSQPGENGAPEQMLSWGDPGDGEPNYILPGDSADFSFTTQPLPIAKNTGVAASNVYAYIATGLVKAPTQVSVVITDSAGNAIGADGLKVGKWENAFDFTPTLDAQGKQVRDGRGEPLTTTIKGVDKTNGYDIIDLDPDRFNVWVYDKQKWDAKTPHIEVKLSTKNLVGFTQYDDPATDVDLVRYTNNKGAGGGWFWSDSQLLVSNKVDDVDPVPGVGADESRPGAEGLPKDQGYKWRVSDRTHRVALRGDVTAEYIFQAGVPGKTDTKPVPARHIVNAHANILNAPDPITNLESPTGVVTVAQVNEDFTRENEQYAQVGIVLVPNHGPNLAWPTGVDLKDGIEQSFGLDA